MKQVDLQKLNDTPTEERYMIEVEKKWNTELQDNELDIEERWDGFKTIIHETLGRVLGYKIRVRVLTGCRNKQRTWPNREG